MDQHADSRSASAIIDHPIRPEWLGTSELSIGQNLELQKQGKLHLLISQRKAVAEAATTSYDPSIPLILGYLDLQLGFTDIVTSNAYRALLLVEEAMKCQDQKQPSKMGEAALLAVSSRLGTSSHIEVQAELRLLKLQAYQTLLMGLAGCCAFWDGLKFASEALKAYPNDGGLKELRYLLKEGFLARNEALQGIEASHEDRIAFTRCGKIYHKQYPWLDGKLFKRTTALIQEVNKSFAKGTCEVRRAFFGPDAEIKARIPISDDEDVGPLGIFATRDIKEGETLMVDRTVLGISDVPSSRLQHCDACHASLQIPYIRPENIVKPKCCANVAFCSISCRDVAVKGYHTVLCGKDFEWLYEDINNTATTKAWSRWRAILFLRVMAVVISDFNALAHDPSLDQQQQQHRQQQHQQHQRRQQEQNPLSHPLLARLTASYPSPPSTALTPTSSSSNTAHEWKFFEDVEAPMRILRQLGIDIFTSQVYTPEIIQTILARLENNASQSTTALIPGSKRVVHMICVNARYVFFNHSCDPNVGWYGAVPSGNVDVGWLNGGVGEGEGEGEGNGDVEGLGMGMGIEMRMGMGMARGMGNWVKPGESAVVCRARKAIGKGEECRISYVGDPMGVGDEEDEEDEEDDDGEGKVKGEKGVKSAKGTEVIEIAEADGAERKEKMIKKKKNESKKTRTGVGRAVKRHELEKWCEGGCGCQVCEAENLASAKESTAVQAGMQADMKEEEKPEAQAQAPSAQEIPAEIIRTIKDIHL